MLWSPAFSGRGHPRRILDLARAGQVELFTSPALLAELEDVLSRRKFARRLDLAGVGLQDLVLGYAALARVILPAKRRWEGEGHDDGHSLGS